MNLRVPKGEIYCGVGLEFPVGEFGIILAAR
jgi:hypothetical protein